MNRRRSGHCHTAWHVHTDVFFRRRKPEKRFDVDRNLKRENHRNVLNHDITELLKGVRKFTIF